MELQEDSEAELLQLRVDVSMCVYVFVCESLEQTHTQTPPRDR